MSPLVALFPEGMLDQVAQFVGRASNRLMYGLRIARYVERLMAFQPGLHRATQRMGGALRRTVLVLQMDLDAGDMRGLMGHGVLDDFANVSGQSLAALDIMVGIDLYLHGPDCPRLPPIRLWGNDPLGDNLPRPR